MKSSNDHCGRFARYHSRREWLGNCANGFGGFALTSLLASKAFGDVVGHAPPPPPSALKPRPPQFQPKAKSVIYLYMDGGPSQVDTFDPKPRLQKESGQPFRMKMEPTQFNDNGLTLGSLWDFKQRGQSGLPVSSLFPYVAECADELCVIRSMTSKFSEHTNANYFMHTGLGLSGRPSMGAWVGYGLGSTNENLPGFVVLNGGLIPPGGVENFGSGFLPAAFQGSIFRPATQPVANIRPNESRAELQVNKLDLI